MSLVRANLRRTGVGAMVDMQRQSSRWRAMQNPYFIKDVSQAFLSFQPSCRMTVGVRRESALVNLNFLHAVEYFLFTLCAEAYLYMRTCVVD